MTKLERLEASVKKIEGVNVITMFVLPPLTAIYGVWSDDWRLFTTAAIIGLTVLVAGMVIIHSRDEERSK